jgi:hypothetical protein
LCGLAALVATRATDMPEKGPALFSTRGNALFWKGHPALWAFGISFGVLILPLLFGQGYRGVDLDLILLPMQCGFRGMSGQSPFISMSLGAGTPLFGEPNAALFYPLSWIFHSFSPELAASLFVVSHLALGAAAMALLGGTLGLSARAALVLGLFGAFHGTALNLITHGIFVVAVVWLPLMWAGAVVATRKKRVWEGAFWIALAAGAMLLGGDLQYAGLSLGVVFFEWALHFWRHRNAVVPKSALQNGAILLGGFFVGAGMASITWFSAFALRSVVARGGALSESMQAAWPTRFPELFGVFWPGIVDRLVKGDTTLRQLHFQSVELDAHWNATPYLGLVALCALFAAPLLRRFRPHLFLALVVFLFSLGDQTPIFGIFTTLIPPLGLFRYPARLLLLAVVLASPAMVQALVVFPRHKKARRILLSVASFLLLASGGFCLFVLVGGERLDAWALALKPEAPSRGYLPTLSALLLQRGLFATSLLAALIALVLFRPRLAAIALAADVMLAAPFILSTSTPLLDFPAPLSGLGSADDTMICQGRHLKTVRLDFPDFFSGALGDSLPAWINRQADLQQCGGPAVPYHYLPAAQRTVVKLFSQLLDESGGPSGLNPALALGCTHLVTRHSPQGLGAVNVIPIPGQGRVFALPQPLDRVLAVEGPLLHESEDQMLSALMKEDGGASLFRHLDDPTGQVVNASLPRGGTPSSAKVVWKSPYQGELSPRGAEGAGISHGAVFVLRRAYWPGFSAHQGGQALKVLRSAGVWLAVVVPDPTQKVTLTYRPPGTWAGLALSLLALTLWMGGAFFVFRPQRRSGRPSPTRTTETSEKSPPSSNAPNPG